MKALILAAGLGTRLLPYTQHTPKPLFPLGDRPLLDIIISRLEAAGCESVIINTHHLHNKITDYINSRKYSIPINTRHEPVILGTAGAIKNAADFWDDKPFIVINSDILTDIDLKEVYSFHAGHGHPATLVLTDCREFNSVIIDDYNFITGFDNSAASQPWIKGKRRLAFTGIQVLNPEILDFIPPNQFSHSIDIYRQMIASGKKIYSYTPMKHSWNDLGTPARYREAVLDELTHKALEKAFPACNSGSFDISEIKGDGSDRRWFRITSQNNSIILADHGIRASLSKNEADSFVSIGKHLYSKGLPVPGIILHDSFSGLLFLEDLGDTNLQHVVMNCGNRNKILLWYKQVISALGELSLTGRIDFDTAWAYQTPYYSPDLIIEKECRYFTEAFLKGCLGKEIDFKEFENEFMRIASRAVENQTSGFMHRDMQSRNIMVKDGKIYFIDFQSGRIGPLQYDLASLLIDPYVTLSSEMRMELLDYCIEILSSKAVFDADKFRICFKYCSITRNLQILGAFGYLSRVKGKTYFEQYIPAALKTLKENFRLLDGDDFPKLKSLIENML
jgi:aminoglycoside/choline kinase family phosphotransferase/CTP:phosphocholine cytidylyltransferase-like protein